MCLVAHFDNRISLEARRDRTEPNRDLARNVVILERAVQLNARHAGGDGRHVGHHRPDSFDTVRKGETLCQPGHTVPFNEVTYGYLD